MKKLLTAMAVSSLLITGCGGSDNDDPQSKSDSDIVVDGKWTEFSPKGDNEDDYLEIKQDELIVNDWSTLNHSLFSLLSAYNPENATDEEYLQSSSAKLIITPLAVYPHDFEIPELVLGKIIQKNENNLTIEPVTDEGKPDLRYQFEFKQIDLSAKTLVDAFPFMQLDIDSRPDAPTDEINLFTKTPFPNGAACLIPVSLQSNVDLLLGFASDGQADDIANDAELYQILADNYATFMASATDTITRTFFDKSTYTGVKSAQGTYATNFTHGMLKGADFYAEGVHSDANNNLSYDGFKQTIQDVDESELNATEKEKVLATLKDRCVYFNETATKFIDEKLGS